ncbi:MAG: Rib/alpha-like domain-containing protein [Planctomycetia bacterium]
MPGSGDDVVIPDLAGTQTITYSAASGSTTINSLASQENFTLSGGSLTVGPQSTLSITGSYTQEAAGVFKTVVVGLPASGDFGVLAATGAASLAGTVEFTADNFLVPGEQSYSVMTFSGRSGVFDAVTPATFGASYTNTTAVIGKPILPSTLASIPQKTVAVGATLTFTASAADLDAPPGGLTYTLDPGAPVGATIDPVTGVFSFTPPATQRVGLFVVGVRVSDGSSAAFTNFVLTVTPGTPGTAGEPGAPGTPGGDPNVPAPAANTAPSFGAGRPKPIGVTGRNGVQLRLLLVGAADTEQSTLGAAVVGLANRGKGKWQFRTTGGWKTITGRVSDRRALLLPPTARLRFVPNAGVSPGRLRIRLPGVGPNGGNRRPLRRRNAVRRDVGLRSRRADGVDDGCAIGGCQPTKVRVGGRRHDALALSAAALDHLFGRSVDN